MAKKKILVVDDSLTVVSMLTALLQEQGYEVISAADGIEAINVFYQKKPDLVLLDIMMPKMNGYQVCRLLKSDPKVKEIPIIMLTGEKEPRDKFWGLQTGANRYLFKESRFSKVLKIVEEELSKSKSRSQEVLGKKETFTSWDILTRLNELLDKKLFEMTTLREITQIARAMHSYDETFTSFFRLLDKVFDYDVGAILLRGEDTGGDLVFKRKEAINKDFIGKVKKKLFEVLPPDEINNHQLKNLEVRVLDQGQQKSSLRESSREIKSFASALLEARGQFIGILAVASTKEKVFTRENLKLLRLIASEASILLDNALLYEEIKKLSITDSLTKLYNHGFFQEQLRQEFERAQRYGLTFSLLMVDIDYFKVLNDTYGHQQGDVILKELAVLMKDTLRRVDIIARYGGDEFIVLLPGTSLRGAVEAANHLRQRVEKHLFPGPKGANKITLSFGVAQYPDKKAATPAELIELTDQALYEAKGAGKNKVCVL